VNKLRASGVSQQGELRDGDVRAALELGDQSLEREVGSGPAAVAPETLVVVEGPAVEERREQDDSGALGLGLQGP
jgi:hypothetical protein